jgi:hypothetical protein
MTGENISRSIASWKILFELSFDLDSECAVDHSPTHKNSSLYYLCLEGRIHNAGIDEKYVFGYCCKENTSQYDFHLRKGKQMLHNFALYWNM